MKLAYLAAAAIAVSAALPAFAQKKVYGYVTQIEVNSAANEVKVWVAPEKGMKGSKDVNFDPADPMLRYKLDLARASLMRRLPVKMMLNAMGMASSFTLRVYPSKKQLPK